MLANNGYEGFIKEHEKTIQAENTNNMPKKQTSFEEKEDILVEPSPKKSFFPLTAIC